MKKVNELLIQYEKDLNELHNNIADLEYSLTTSILDLLSNEEYEDLVKHNVEAFKKVNTISQSDLYAHLKDIVAIRNLTLKYIDARDIKLEQKHFAVENNPEPNTIVLSKEDSKTLVDFIVSLLHDPRMF